MLISRLQGWVLGDLLMQKGSVRLVVPDEEAKGRMEEFLGTDQERFGRRGVFVVKVKEG